MEGRTVLITGGAKRIGCSIAMKFAREGASILLHCNNSLEEAKKVKSDVESLGNNCELFVADLSTKDGRMKLVEEVLSSSIVSQRGGLDVLINSASIFKPSKLESQLNKVDDNKFDWFDAHFKINLKAPLILSRSFAKDVDEKDWEMMMEINAKAPYFLTKYLLRNIKNVNGCVVNLIDNSYERPWPFYSSYCASKSALRSITLSLAIELAPDVRVNGIAPGAILFPDWMEKSSRQEILTKVPMKREGTPDEIADTAFFLAAGPQYITGQVIAVDGGWSLCD